MSDPLETILLQCAHAAPEPWYPSGYAQANGIKRDDLDPYLDKLRMAGLIHLTDWVQGKGQGYALTPEGDRIRQSPRELARLRAGKLNPARQVHQQPPYSGGRRLTAFERGEEIRAAFLYPSPPIVTYCLIFLNIAWFVPELLLSLHYQLPLNEFLVGYARQPAQGLIFNRVLSETGALSGEHIVQGGWNWARLITCCFVHIGLLHLGVNMYSLWVVGPFFEQLWGRTRFLVLYLVAGLGGSCAMVIMNMHGWKPGYPVSIGAGASGALWGILAAHAVWIVANRRYLPRQLGSQMLRQVLIVLVINVGITYGVPGISAAAHFGGGAVGAVTAVLLNCHRYGGSLLRGLALGGLIATPVLCVSAVALAERVDPSWQKLRILMRANLLLQHKPKDPSLQEVQEAVEDLEKARAVLSNAIAQLPQKRLVEDWQNHVKYLEDLSNHYAVAELDEFIGPLIAEERRRTVLAYQEQWRALQNTDKDELTPEAVEQLIAPCRKARERLEAALAVLRQAGPFQEQGIERPRLRALKAEERRLEGWNDTEQRWRERAQEQSRSTQGTVQSRVIVCATAWPPSLRPCSAEDFRRAAKQWHTDRLLPEKSCC
jgi:membrane associated rhomboid family serine protease